MMTSVLENASETVDFYLLNQDLSSQDKNTFTALTETYDCSINFVNIDPSKFSSDYITTTDNWSIEAYFRLLMTEVLPLTVERLLYLDVDIIVDKPLDSLYYQDFDGNNFCVCREITFDGVFNDYRQEVFSSLLENGYQYFNSGVMLWNLKQLRSQGYYFEKYLQLAANTKTKLLAFDQDLLNLMHHNEVRYVDEYLYDLFPRFAYANGIHCDDVKNETVIVHFTGEKPWEGKYIHYDIEKLWWEYAKKTPFYQSLLEDFLEGCLGSSFVYDIVKMQKDEIVKIQSFLKRLNL